MKISAWHKAQGDTAEFAIPIKPYDRVYVSKVFGKEYSPLPNICFRADEIVYGGTGFAITIENGKEVYHKDRAELIGQLSASRAWVNFSQGLDARFITQEVAELLTTVKTKRVHFAFDFMKNEKAIKRGLEIYKRVSNLSDDKAIVYILTNYDTTIADDLYRVNLVRALGYLPDVRIYRKPTAPQVLKDLQRWCNNRRIFRTCEFMDYKPRKDGKTIKELYFS